jgi:uncharacterized protein (TIGR02145 family)
MKNVKKSLRWIGIIGLAGLIAMTMMWTCAEVPEYCGNGAENLLTDPLNQFCFEGKTVSKCGGKEYNTQTEECDRSENTSGTVREKCVGGKYVVSGGECEVINDPCAEGATEACCAVRPEFTGCGDDDPCADGATEACCKVNPDFTGCGEGGDSTYLLTIYRNTGGTVSRKPDQQRYIAGTSVTVTATPDSGYLFAGWTGAPAGANISGDIITFTINNEVTLNAYFKQNNFNPEITYGSLTDPRNGQTYYTVKIGDQTWMAENLNFDAPGSLCHRNEESNCYIYGRLYEWNTVMDGSPSSSLNPSRVQGICPDGWHIPSDAEWTTLDNHVAGDITTRGTRLKARGGWTNDSNGTDDFGFSALPGGRGGRFGGFDSGYAYWWSTTGFGSSTTSTIYCRYISNSSNGRLFRSDISRDFKHSLRCVQD